MALDLSQRSHLAGGFMNLANLLFFGLLLVLLLAEPANPFGIAAFGVVSYATLFSLSLWLLKGVDGKEWH